MSVVTYSLKTTEFLKYWFIFLTNWGVVLCLITTFIGSCLVTRWHFDAGYVGMKNYNLKIDYY